MPKTISTKCNVFLQLIILHPHPHFTRHVRKKDPQKHPHFTRLKIRRSADPQIHILPEANAQRDGRPAEYRWRPLFNAAKFG